jgi:hypothetical protein
MNEIITKEQREAALEKHRPLEIAEWIYTNMGGWTHDDFAKELWDHLLNGFVVSSPHHFMMYRAVALDDGRNAWLVNSGVGPVKDLIRFFPFPLECIAWYRCKAERRLRVYRYKRFIELVERGKIQ